MRQIKKGKQLLAMALSALLAAGGLPTTVFADGGGQKSGEHTEECYTDDLICGYIVDEGNIASDSDATASDSDAEHTHTQECYALDCPHERAATDSDSSTIMITDFEDLEDQVKVQPVPYGTPRDSLELPGTLDAFGYSVDGNTESAPEPEAVTIGNVTWELTGEDNSPTEYEEERITSCTYYFQAVLPEGYDLAGIAVLPQIEVRYGWDYRMVGKKNQNPGYAFNEETGHLTILSKNGMNGDWRDPGNDVLGKIISVEMDDSITAIPANAFANCNNLTTINLPDNLIKIETNAFLECWSLTLDALPDSVEEIGVSAFQSCNSLALTSLPRNITRIGSWAFNYCYSISSLTFTSDQAPTLENDAFNGTTFPIYVPENGNGYTSGSWANLTDRVISGAELTSLTVSEGRLDPDFSPAQTDYTVSVGNNIDTINVTPTFNGSGTITVNGDKASSGEASSISLNVGKTDISIVVVSVNGDSRIYDVEVTRAPVSVTGVTLNHSSYTLYTNIDPSAFQLTATVQPTDAPDTTVHWESSNTAVATVNDAGTVNAVAPGVTTITATTNDGGKKATCTVTVRKAVTGVTLDQSAYTLYTNKNPMNFKLAASVQPNDASDTAVIWKSSDKNVATVSDDGTVNAVAPGTAIITAITNDGGKKAACTVTVRTHSRSGGNDSSDDSHAYTNPDHLHGTWIQTDTGNWMFRQSGGSYAKNRWGMVDGLWYFFDGEGKMLTGWQFLGGQWYYLYTKEDTAAKAGIKEGAMAVGWYFDPQYQKWFYFDTSGAMVTGWREIDGKWHYFNPESDGTRGAMVTDNVVDGRYIDKSGVWYGTA